MNTDKISETVAKLIAFITPVLLVSEFDPKVANILIRAENGRWTITLKGGQKPDIEVTGDSLHTCLDEIFAQVFAQVKAFRAQASSPIHRQPGMN